MFEAGLDSSVYCEVVSCKIKCCNVEVNLTITVTESNNTAYANISVLQNSPNGPVEFNITAYDETQATHLT